MGRKTLIIHLLLALVLLPVVQAMGPVATEDNSKISHDLVLMDCGQMDPAHCVDFDDCAAGSHGSCDSKSKTGMLLPLSIIPSSASRYNLHPVDRYSTHHSELLLRPPRNA